MSDFQKGLNNIIAATRKALSARSLAWSEAKSSIPDGHSQPEKNVLNDRFAHNQSS
jgi:hypothetical protein